MLQVKPQDDTCLNPVWIGFWARVFEMHDELTRRQAESGQGQTQEKAETQKEEGDRPGKSGRPS